MLYLIERRVYDITGTTDNNLNVYLNNKKLNIKSFDKYCDLYLDKDKKFMKKYSHEICVSVSKTMINLKIIHLLMVFSPKGGKHVDVITKQITSVIK